MLFSDPHFQWRKKIIICVAFFFIFRTTFSMGEENHHLCCVFFIFRPTFSMGEENHDLFFSDPHFQWRRKIIICVAFFLNFPTHIFNGARKSSSVLRFFLFSGPNFQWGKKIIICVAFFFKFCQNSTLYYSAPLTQSPCSSFILHDEMGMISKVKMGLRSKRNKI